MYAALKKMEKNVLRLDEALRSAAARHETSLAACSHCEPARNLCTWILCTLGIVIIALVVLCVFFRPRSSPPEGKVAYVVASPTGAPPTFLTPV